MRMDRGQGDPPGAVIGGLIVAIISLLGIYIFSELNQTINVGGSLGEAQESLLVGGADALMLAAGGTGIVIATILLLRGLER